MRGPAAVAVGAAAVLGARAAGALAQPAREVPLPPWMEDRNPQHEARWRESIWEDPWGHERQGDPFAWEEGADFNDWEEGERQWLRDLEVEVVGCRQFTPDVRRSAAPSNLQLVYDVEVRMPRGQFKPGFVVLASSKHDESVYSLAQPSAFSLDNSLQKPDHGDHGDSQLETSMSRVVSRARNIPRNLKRAFQKLVNHCMEEHSAELESYKHVAQVQKVWRTKKNGSFPRRVKHSSKFWTEESCETDNRVFTAFMVGKERKAQGARGRKANRRRARPRDIPAGGGDVLHDMEAAMEAVLMERKEKWKNEPSIVCEASNEAHFGSGMHDEYLPHFEAMHEHVIDAKVTRCSKVKPNDPGGSRLKYQVGVDLPKFPPLKLPQDLRGFALLLSSTGPGGLSSPFPDDPTWNGQGWGQPGDTTGPADDSYYLTVADRIIPTSGYNPGVPGAIFGEAMKAAGVGEFDVFDRPDFPISRDSAWRMIKDCAPSLEPMIQLDGAALRVEGIRPVTGEGGGGRGDFTAFVDSAYPNITCPIDGRHFQVLYFAPDFQGTGPVCNFSPTFLYQDSFARVLDGLEESFSPGSVQVLTALATLWRLDIDPKQVRDIIENAGVKRDSDVGRLFSDLVRLSKNIQERMDELTQGSTSPPGEIMERFPWVDPNPVTVPPGSQPLPDFMPDAPTEAGP